MSGVQASTSQYNESPFETQIKLEKNLLTDAGLETSVHSKSTEQLNARQLDTKDI